MAKAPSLVSLAMVHLFTLQGIFLYRIYMSFPLNYLIIYSHACLPWPCTSYNMKCHLWTRMIMTLPMNYDCLYSCRKLGRFGRIKSLLFQKGINKFIYMFLRLMLLLHFMGLLHQSLQASPG